MKFLQTKEDAGILQEEMEMVFKKDAKTGRGWRFALPAMVVGALLTVTFGVGMTTTDSAAFCGSCHAMAEAALTHKSSVHAQLSCNDCHAPHNMVARIPFKAKEGARDVWATVSGSIPDLIHPGGETKAITQANCLRCHGSTTSSVIMKSKQYCTDCHRHVPHSPKIPVAKRSAADA